MESRWCTVGICAKCLRNVGLEGRVVQLGAFPLLLRMAFSLVNNPSGLLGAVVVFLHESLYFIESFSGIT